MSSPAVAQELLALAATLPRTQARSPALLAIAILEHHLQLAAQPHTSTLSLQTHLALELCLADALFRYTASTSAAETILARVSARLGHDESLIPLRIDANALLARCMAQAGQTKAAVKVLTQSATLAVDRGRADWEYTAHLQRYAVAPSQSLLRTMAQVAKSRGHLQVEQLANLLACLAQLRQGVRVTFPETTPGMTPPTVLSLTQQIVELLCDVAAAENAAALPRLARLHATLDAHPWPVAQRLHLAQGQTLHLSWLSQAQGFALVSALSAQIHLGDLVSHRAARFLQDGARQLVHVQDAAWARRMRVALETMQAMDATVRQQFGQAQALLARVRQETGSTARLCFLEASWLQAQGRLREAMPLLSNLAQVALQPSAGASTADLSIALVAGLCAVLIYRSTTEPSLFNPSQAASLLATLRPRCSQGGHLSALLHLVTATDRACHTAQPLEVRRLLAGLITQSGRHAHTDLKMLALATLASATRNKTDPPAALLQFNQAAYGLAARQTQECSAWALWHGLGLQHALAGMGMVTEAAQQEGINRKIREVLASRGQLATVPWL